MTDFAAMPLLDVAKLNTPQALDYFWVHVDNGYFDDRANFYEYVADECHRILRYQKKGAITVLDVGCAQGHFLRALALKLGDPAMRLMEGWDYAQSAIHIANRQYAASPPIFWVMDILEASGNAPYQYDLVTCLQTLEHIRQWEKAIQNMLGLLRPGGDFVLTIPNGETDTYNGHVNFWTEEAMSDALSKYGCVVESWPFNNKNNLFFHVRKKDGP